MKLIIVSHTPHYKTENGLIVGWGPTIREINSLTQIFSEILHLAPFHNEIAPRSSLTYLNNIKYIPLFPSGGKSLKHKINILLASYRNFKIIKKYIHDVDWIHLRAPTNLMFYVLPMLKLNNISNCWIKYAGSWRDVNISFTYKFQRYILKKYFSEYKITVNGRLANDSDNILSFENPSLDKNDLLFSDLVLNKKEYNNPLQICFVGQLEIGKGIIQLLEALLDFDSTGQIEHLHIVGDGALFDDVEKIVSKFHNTKVTIYGYLDRAEINRIYAVSHINILPSSSEGFPKVIAEGLIFGAIPVVTNISALSEYFNGTNGFLINENHKDDIVEIFNYILSLDAFVLKKIALSASVMGNIFTYDYYLNNLKKKIFNDFK